MIGLRNDRQRRPRRRDGRYRRLGLEPVEGRLLLSAVLGDPLAEDEPNGQQPAETADEDPDPAAADNEEQATAPGIPLGGGFVPVEDNGDIPWGGNWLQATDAEVSHGGGSSEGIEIRRLDPGEFAPAGPDPGLIDLTWVAERPVEVGGVPVANSEGAAGAPAVSAPRTPAGARSEGISVEGAQGRSQAFELAAESSHSARESGNGFGDVELASVRFGDQRSARPASAPTVGGPDAGGSGPSTADEPRYRRDHGERFAVQSARPLRDEALVARQGGRSEETPQTPPTALATAPQAEGSDPTGEDAAQRDDLQVAYLENRRRDDSVPLVALAMLHWQLSRRFWHPYEEQPRRKDVSA